MSFKYYRFPKDVILNCVRWYLRYKLSYRDLEEMMAERDIQLDHATLNRWVLKFSPLLMAEARKHKHPVDSSWRLDETYIKVKGHWKYLYRTDKGGDTIDFSLTAKRDLKAAFRFLKRSIKSSVLPEKVNIDKSGSNKAAIERYNDDFNTIIEQEHRFVKQKMRAALGFKSFRSAKATISGLELIRMIRKGQLCLRNEASNIDQFNRLAA